MAAAATADLSTVLGDYPVGDVYDEALDAPQHPRPGYDAVLARLAGRDLGAAAARVRAAVLDEGCTFGATPFRVDPVPRVLVHDEWTRLAAGLEQRVRALDAFVADVYGERRVCAAGVVPDRVVDGAEHFEPELAAFAAPRVRVGLAGMDVIRRPDGAFAVLEDNLRTPSGLAYLGAARRAVAAELAPGFPAPVEVEECVLAALGRVLRAAGPEDARIIVLTDGRGNTAHWEHARLADGLGLPLVELRDLDHDGPRLLADGQPVDVVYRRTDEDRLRDERGALTRVGRVLAEPLRAGRLSCVNALGNGVADDKLVHAYVEDMVRFYLGEQPLLPSVPTYDLHRAEDLELVLDRIAELVVKPRSGYGGVGVYVGPQADAAERERMRELVRSRPEAFVAQETIRFSRHPTVVDGRLAPRHVDLRAFVAFDGEWAQAVPGGLSRVAFAEDELVVNSSQGGGAKDTWVLGR